LPILPYSPEDFDAVRAFASRRRVSILTHREFVDYYYSTRSFCKLYLYLEDKGNLVGTIGIELLNFQYRGMEIVAGVASNFHVAVPGIGGYLYFHWVKTCPFSLEFGGSEDAHKIVSQQRWTCFNGIKKFILNYDYPVYPNNRWWSRAAKWAVRNATRKAISKFASGIPREVLTRISVREEHEYQKDLLPRQSPFDFRLAPSIEYLAWRYKLGLSFVRYRLFRVFSNSSTLGYVILSDFPDRIVVAQSDGDDPSGLAYGTLLSILEVARDDRKPRKVLLLSSHRQMQTLYEHFGFRPEQTDFFFALSSLRQRIEIPLSTSSWLINYDWCDQGLFDTVVPKSRT
jgi:hypothetical protein